MNEISIVIPICNGWEFTDACLLSIIECTKINDINIVVIDNNSTDETQEVLNRYKNMLPMTVITNDRNIGFPESVNLGISCRTNGEDICLLNNDTLVSQGWIEGLRRHFDKRDVGIVGACSNKIIEPQRRYMPAYSSKEDFYKESKKFRKENNGRYQYAHKISGMCMLLRGEMMDEIGLFDPIYTPGNFEDDDICCRAIENDWYPVIAEEVFIHHFGSSTFNLLGVDYDGLLERNYKIFKKKWGSKYDDLIKKIERKNKSIRVVK